MEQEDDFEKYVRRHREDFDTELPGIGLWDRIEQRLDQKERKYEYPKIIPFPYAWRTFALSAVAAVILLLLGISYIIFMNNDSPSGKPPVVYNVTISLKDLSPENAEVESFYQSVINRKLEEVKKYNLADLGMQGSME
jgi:hypothetical protein